MGFCAVEQFETTNEENKVQDNGAQTLPKIHLLDFAIAESIEFRFGFPAQIECLI